jgi:hypothetical protein
MGQLFDVTHILYIVISLLVTVMLWVMAKRCMKTEKQKNRFFFIFSLLTFLLHISIMWVDFLDDAQAGVADNILFPIYFCNVSMYLLFILSLVENKKTRLFRFFAILGAYGGIFGSLISLFYPQYYLGAASIFQWGVFKSMLSHSTMLVAAGWLLIGGYFSINIRNVFSYMLGLLFYGAIGVFVNWLFRINGLYDPNAMYLSHPPLAEAPFLNAYVISILMCLVMSIGICIYHRSRHAKADTLDDTPIEQPTTISSIHR